MSNEVQRNFVNEAVYPQLERMIRIVHQLDAFVLDYNAIQASADALPTDATVINTKDDVTPRSDVANITGADIATLATICSNMSAQLGTAAKQALVGKMVRDLNTVIRN